MSTATRRRPADGALDGATIVTRDRRRLAVARLGVVGGALGVAAGVVQATLGTRIPDWTGAKASPGLLGLLTIVLATLAGLAALRQRNPHLTVGARAGYAMALLVPGLLCFTTVGRLWFLPGPLLLAAGLLGVERWRATASVVAANWLRCLLSALGVFELLMAAGATPVLMVVGAVGGLALIAAAWLREAPRGLLAGLVAAGTVPFAAQAWTALVPIVLLLAAVGVSVPIIRSGAPRTRSR